MQSLNKGFTFVELILVIALLSLLLAVVLPQVEGIKNEGKLAKAESEIALLKNAIEIFYQQKEAFPANITVDLLALRPVVINKVPADPFKTSLAGESFTYGYVNGGTYYIVYSRGLDNNNQNWQVVKEGGRLVLQKNNNCLNIIESNLEIR